MAATSPSRSAERIMIRLPDGYRRLLKVRAAQNDRTVNGEVVSMLKSVIEAEKMAPVPQA